MDCATSFRSSLSSTAIGFTLGGRAKERLASDFYVSSSARTLRRHIYDEPVGKAERIGILGVDDFAFRKGQQYTAASTLRRLPYNRL